MRLYGFWPLRPEEGFSPEAHIGQETGQPKADLCSCTSFLWKKNVIKQFRTGCIAKWLAETGIQTPCSDEEVGSQMPPFSVVTLTSTPGLVPAEPRSQIYVLLVPACTRRILLALPSQHLPAQDISRHIGDDTWHKTLTTIRIPQRTSIQRCHCVKGETSLPCADGENQGRMRSLSI